MIFIASETNRTNYEGILKTELFNGYDPDVKPTRHAWDPIDVSLTLYLYQIENLVSTFVIRSINVFYDDINKRATEIPQHTGIGWLLYTSKSESM